MGPRISDFPKSIVVSVLHAVCDHLHDSCVPWMEKGHACFRCSESPPPQSRVAWLRNLHRHWFDLLVFPHLCVSVRTLRRLGEKHPNPERSPRCMMRGEPLMSRFFREPPGQNIVRTASVPFVTCLTPVFSVLL